MESKRGLFFILFFSLFQPIYGLSFSDLLQTVRSDLSIGDGSQIAINDSLADQGKVALRMLLYTCLIDIAVIKGSEIFLGAPKLPDQFTKKQENDSNFIVKAGLVAPFVEEIIFTYFPLFMAGQESLEDRHRRIIVLSFVFGLLHNYKDNWVINRFQLVTAIFKYLPHRYLMKRRLTNVVPFLHHFLNNNLILLYRKGWKEYKDGMISTTKQPCG